MSETVTFQSNSRSLRVSFPTEIFGFGEGMDYTFDESGKKVAAPLPFPPVKFAHGRADVKGDRVAFMRQHTGNEKNGGSDFFEHSEEIAAVVAAHGAAHAQMPEGGMTNEDRADLAYLIKAAKHMAPAQVEKVREMIPAFMQRYTITGIAAPPETLAISRLKARLIEILGILEDHEVTDDGRGVVEGGPGPIE